MKINKTILIPVFIIGMVIGGCSELMIEPKKTQQKLRGTSTSVLSTKTPVNTTKIHSTSTTIALEKTSSPTSTLTPREKRIMITQILDNNGGCKLPCLWGVDPNKTKQNQVDTFLQQFLTQQTQELDDLPNFYVSPRSTGDITVGILRDNTYIVMDYMVVEDESNTKPLMIILSLSALEVLETGENNINKYGLSYNSVNYLNMVEYYSIPNILSLYGKPNDVLLGTWPEDPQLSEDQFHEFLIILDYSSKGFLIEYASVKKINDGSIIVCPLFSHIRVAAYSLEKDISPDYVAEYAGFAWYPITDNNFYKRIDEATSLTIDEFYTIYKDDSNSNCFELSADLWAFEK